jgi:hypothetical protein
MDRAGASAALLDDAEHLVHRRRPAQQHALAKPGVGSDAGNVLHHEVGLALVLPEREDLDHVRMAHARHGARLVQEAPLRVASATSAGDTNLTATSRISHSSRARSTRPMPPEPSSRSTV